jgi:uncharacterized integral membrane protein
MSEERSPGADRPQPDLSRRWLGVVVVATLVVVPIAILIFSNTSSHTVSWLGFEATAPQWLVLMVTFVAGMIGGKVFGMIWRRRRRRREQGKQERAVLRKHGHDPGRD